MLHEECVVSPQGRVNPARPFSPGSERMLGLPDEAGANRRVLPNDSPQHQDAPPLPRRRPPRSRRHRSLHRVSLLRHLADPPRTAHPSPPAPPAARRQRPLHPAPPLHRTQPPPQTAPGPPPSPPPPPPPGPVRHDGGILSWWRAAFTEIRDPMRALGVEPEGPAGGLYHTELFLEEEGDATVFVPVLGPTRTVGRAAHIVIPAAELAVTLHAGSHDDIDRTYGALGAYVQEHEIGIDGPVRES